MKTLLITLLLSVGLFGITLGAFAQDSQPDAPAAGSKPPDTFTLKIQYPQPIRILRYATNDKINFANNCNSGDNNNCSFQLSGSSGNIAVVVGPNDTNHCILSIHYDPSGDDYFTMAPACGGDLTASGLNHAGHYQYQISLSQQPSSR